MSHPPKSTILAFRARWVAFSAVFFNAGATGAAGVDMWIPFRTITIGGPGAGGQTAVAPFSMEESDLEAGFRHGERPRHPDAGGGCVCALPGSRSPQRAERLGSYRPGCGGNRARRLAFDTEAAPASSLSP